MAEASQITPRLDYLPTILPCINYFRKVDQDDAKTGEDKILSGLNILKGRLADVIEDQADLKEYARGIKVLVNQVRSDSQQHVKV